MVAPSSYKYAPKLDFDPVHPAHFDPPPPRHDTGTLFAFHLDRETKVLGWIIRNDANLWGFNDDYLIYFYHPSCKPTPKCKIPALDKLLFPPVIMSDEGWRFGKFKTLRVEPVTKDQTLPLHLFRSADAATGYVDAAGASIVRPADLPDHQVGIWEHTFVHMVEERIRKALNLAPAVVKQPESGLSLQPGVTVYLAADGPAATPLDRGEIAEQLAEALGDLAELGDEGSNVETGEMAIEFNGPHPARIAKKIRATLKKMNLGPGLSLGIRSGRGRILERRQELTDE
jgi:hypothetical protein